jgi:RNA polymerase sigma-70 factor (ECF subfamily)
MTVQAQAISQFNQDIVSLIPHLRAFGRMITQNPDKANDLVQDTIVRALRAEHQFTPGTNMKAWLFTILRNLHVNNLRRNKIRFDSIEDGALDYFAVASNQESHLELKEMQRCMTKLSREHREILILVGASGFSYEEAAEICKCAVGTIKSRLSRGRQELYELMVEGDEAKQPRRAGRVVKKAVRRIAANEGKAEQAAA